MCETWLIYRWGVTHSCVRRDSFVCETWRVHVCVTWLIQPEYCQERSLMCDMTHSHVWHDWFIYVWNENCKYNTTHSHVHSHVWQDSCVCVTWFIRVCVTWLIKPQYRPERSLTCDVTRSDAWQDSFTTFLIHMCDMTHSLVWHDSFTICLIHICGKRPIKIRYSLHLRHPVISRIEENMFLCNGHIEENVFLCNRQIEENVFLCTRQIEENKIDRLKRICFYVCVEKNIFFVYASTWICFLIEENVFLYICFYAEYVFTYVIDRLKTLCFYVCIYTWHANMYFKNPGPRLVPVQFQLFTLTFKNGGKNKLTDKTKHSD